MLSPHFKAVQCSVTELIFRFVSGYKLLSTACSNNYIIFYVILKITVSNQANRHLH